MYKNHTNSYFINKIFYYFITESYLIYDRNAVIKGWDGAEEWCDICDILWQDEMKRVMQRRGENQTKYLTLAKHAAV